MTYQLDREEMDMVRDIVRILTNSTIWSGGDASVCLDNDDNARLCRLAEELSRRIT